MVPSGASTGAHEAVELRDGDEKRYGGKGVLKGRREREQRHRRGLGRGRRPTSNRSRDAVPMMNILNGGEHADNNVDLQEFMIQPSAPTTSPKGCAWASRSSTR